MAKSSFISHTVNGYSRYDVPESKAFSCTPGILYPVRIDFINARDRVTISQGVDIRSNSLAVPTFNPYTVRLHRFWVPLQLYHPELRTNSSKFDMNNLSLNWIPARAAAPTQGIGYAKSGVVYSYTNSLLSWLRITNRYVYSSVGASSSLAATTLPSDAVPSDWANADTYLAYWDIVRNYYSYSQWGLYSFAWPASWAVANASWNFSDSKFFNQRYGNLEYLDAYFESQFYPGSIKSNNNTYNRSNLWYQILSSDLANTLAVNSDGYPVNLSYPGETLVQDSLPSQPNGQFTVSETGSTASRAIDYFLLAHPMAVVPSNPDRYSRLMPPGSSSDDVAMSGVTTIPQLAIASRLQEYKDLLGAGGNRYSDWLETFFASKIEHVDRPKLLFSASQTVNVQVVMNQSGPNNFDKGYDSAPLGQMGGAICFNTQLGRKQSYYFREPGYMIDMFSIRPVYFWCGVRPDYLGYKGADYFNPVYNDIGYQDVAYNQLFYNVGFPNNVAAREPCFNEFRSSYDEVMGSLCAFDTSLTYGSSSKTIPLYSFWVQQRAFALSGAGVIDRYYNALFVDMDQVNSPFASDVEDNFFVNMSYAVLKKSLVNKTFATRLSNR